MKIILLKYEEIDFEAYNRCIEASPHGAIYAMSWYLDAVSPRWELLMADNYRYVMPLPVKRKWGVKYLMQPYFCQQLGIFFTQPLSSEIFKSFVSAIPYFFYYIQLNAGNVFDSACSKIKDNFVLDLNKSYPEIRKSYKKNFVRNIRKAEEKFLRIEKNTDWEMFLYTIKNNSENRPIRRLFPVFESFMRRISQYATIEIWSVKNERQAILSSALFFRWRDKIYYMLPVSTPEGKENQSMSFLLDQWIQIHSERKLWLDFEGSSIPNVARFYQSTGAVKETFPLVIKPEVIFKGLSFVKNRFR
jgi:hypothetical protein